MAVIAVILLQKGQHYTGWSGIPKGKIRRDNSPEKMFAHPDKEGSEGIWFFLVCIRRREVSALNLKENTDKEKLVWNRALIYLSWRLETSSIKSTPRQDWKKRKSDSKTELHTVKRRIWGAAFDYRQLGVLTHKTPFNFTLLCSPMLSLPSSLQVEIEGTQHWPVLDPSTKDSHLNLLFSVAESIGSTE